MMGGWGLVGLIAMLAMMGGMGWMMWTMMRGSGGGRTDAPDEPADVLKARYARGELSTDEFQERLQAIQDAKG